jgi:hypothetical protein
MKEPKSTLLFIASVFTSVPRLQEGLSLSHMITILHCSIITPLKILALSQPRAETLPLRQFCLQLLHGLVEIAPQRG